MSEIKDFFSDLSLPDEKKAELKSALKAKYPQYAENDKGTTEVFRMENNNIEINRAQAKVRSKWLTGGAVAAAAALLLVVGAGAAKYANKYNAPVASPTTDVVTSDETAADKENKNAEEKQKTMLIEFILRDEDIAGYSGTLNYRLMRENEVLSMVSIKDIEKKHTASVSFRAVGSGKQQFELYVGKDSDSRDEVHYATIEVDFDNNKYEVVNIDSKAMREFIEKDLVFMTIRLPLPDDLSGNYTAQIYKDARPIGGQAIGSADNIPDHIDLEVHGRGKETLTIRLLNEDTGEAIDNYAVFNVDYDTKTAELVGDTGYSVKESNSSVPNDDNSAKNLRTFAMPDLVGTDIELASVKYDRTLRFDIIGEYNSDYDAGVIFEQSVAVGETVSEGTRVTVKVSKGPKELSRNDLTLSVPFPEGLSGSYIIEAYCSGDVSYVQTVQDASLIAGKDLEFDISGTGRETVTIRVTAETGKYVDFATFNVDYDNMTAELVGDFKKDELLALSNS